MTILETLRSRGYWRLLVRPTDFDELRVPELGRLEEIVRESQVNVRGWYFPHISDNFDIKRGADWIGQESEFQYHMDVWRFFQSGQFVYLRSLWADWRDRPIWDAVPANWEPGTELPVEDAIYLYSEALEWTARLAATEAGGDAVDLKIGLFGMEGRKLSVNPGRRMPFLEPRTANAPEWEDDGRFTRAQLAAEARELAIGFAQRLFARFHWDVRKHILRNLQNELLQGRL